jgi:hypothetical protein
MGSINTVKSLASDPIKVVKQRLNPVLKVATGNQPYRDYSAGKFDKTKRPGEEGYDPLKALGHGLNPYEQNTQAALSALKGLGIDLPGVTRSR